MPRFERPKVTAAEYDRAAQLWTESLLDRATNLLIVPTWLRGRDAFTYKLEHADRHEYLVVEAATGQSAPAFDHELVGRALGATPGRLPITAVDYDGEVLVLTLDDGGITRVDPATGAVTTVPAAEPGTVPLAGGGALFVREHNLWVRETDGAERQLTSGGEEDYGWAEAPDGDAHHIDRARAGRPHNIMGVFPNADGSKVLVPRVDERAVTAYPLLESITLDGNPVPTVHHVRRKLPGDPADTLWNWYILDIATGRQVPVVGLDAGREIQPWHAYWTDHGTVIAFASTPAQDRMGAVEIDAATGAVRMIHDEADHMFRFNGNWFNDDNVRHLPDRNALVWFTYASGWPHLWLLDLRTGAIRQLTDGDWAVVDLLQVTADRAYFTAGGIVPGRNPYYRALCRVDLDGDGPNAALTILTDEDADHAFPPVPQGIGSSAFGAVPRGARSPLAPSGKFFVDNASRVDRPGRAVLRDESGAEIAELARTDISGLSEIGWLPPEVFCAKAADGRTDVWGVILKPRAFAEQDSWPVLERIYGPPQVLTQPRSFLEGLAGTFMYGVHALADMGFGVVVMDAPGTPHRSKEFRDMHWGQADRFGIADHRAVIENLAATRPWMDIECVGISGHSSGGYGTVMAMLLEPDFYRVGFASSAALDPSASGAYIYESHFGRPDYGDGRHVRRQPGEVAPNYRAVSPSAYADRLTGRLALVVGDLDEECELPGQIQFLGALVDARRDYDLIMMAGHAHYYTTEPYYQKRLWDYFIDHVQGREPLAHHQLPVTRGVRLGST